MAAVGGAKFIEGNRYIYALKVPSQFPLVILVKVGCRKCKSFGSVAWREAEHAHTALDQIPEPFAEIIVAHVLRIIRNT